MSCFLNWRGVPLRASTGTDTKGTSPQGHSCASLTAVGDSESEPSGLGGSSSKGSDSERLTKISDILNHIVANDTNSCRLAYIISMLIYHTAACCTRSVAVSVYAKTCEHSEDAQVRGLPQACWGKCTGCATKSVRLFLPMWFLPTWFPLS